MELLEAFFKLLGGATQGAPAMAALTIAVVVGLFAIWLYSRKIDIDAINTIGNLQSKQIQDLQALVRSLTEELSEARKEIAEISKQNKEMRKHIVKLEKLLIQNGLNPPDAEDDDA
jgi:septal ring factor EnvC (AmiA/AmiB activator)